jgi:hypothetical protein
MTDLFVSWLDDKTIVIVDAEQTELWRGSAQNTIDLLRTLAEYGAIGLYEDEESIP